jgi:hypothetical protein
MCSEAPSGKGAFLAFLLASFNAINADQSFLVGGQLFLFVEGVPLDKNEGVSRDSSSPQCFAAPLGSQRGGGPKL